MANFTPDEMAAINEMGRAGMLSPERVQGLLKEMAPQIQEMQSDQSFADRMLRSESGAAQSGQSFADRMLRSEEMQSDQSFADRMLRSEEMQGGNGLSLAHQMLRKESGAAITEGELRALVPSFLRVETGAALTEEEIQAAMEALMRPMEPSLGALPGGEDILPGEPRAAFSAQELMQMQGAN